MSIEVSCSTHEQAQWQRWVPVLRALWPSWQLEDLLDADPTELKGYQHRLVVRWHDADAQAAADAARASELGQLADVEPSASLREAYRRLTNPAERLQFAVSAGTGCGMNGPPPQGLEEMQMLVAANRYDLVRAVLRGPLPAARAYAEQALRAQGHEQQDDLATFSAIRKSGGYVHVCGDCTDNRDEPEWSADVFRPKR